MASLRRLPRDEPEIYPVALVHSIQNCPHDTVTHSIATLS